MDKPQNDEFRHESRNSSKRGRPRSKEKLDKLRTILWFECVRNHVAGEEASAYEVELAIRQKFFKEWQDLKNRWSKYKSGEHVPRPELSEMVERVVPGSNRLLNHPLWAALRDGEKTQSQIDTLLRQLAAPIQEIVFSRKEISYPRSKLTLGRLDRLRKAASWDSLACLVLLLHEAHLLGKTEQAMWIGRSIYTVLLMLYSVDEFEPVGRVLLESLQEKIFSLTQHRGMSIRLCPDAFHEQAELLADLVATHERSLQKQLSKIEKLALLYKMSEGRAISVSCRFLYDPILRAEK